ncbi:sn-glycerol-3-phosphate ABC transporter ATP-binding protein UgpC [Halobacteria archaeon AArc-curdl1]|uniref:ABC-type D-xylose/L-arabinose transporter n=1 Tax=Natronosalvus hydrolyticus TaxID=2979988 RepID=A0AAP3E7X5_9EURY|nr:sn-glycerol-3-phosphate ABC transporter ATP-binding protein UgpC [Halobacteria archaeon AArc-curdl1]
MATLELQNLTKRFADGSDEIVAVDDVSLEVGDGEFLVLVGPSGCGKSTTLRMIAGLESVTSGTILLDEEPIGDRPPQRRDIAMVFQNYALYPHMTVRGNMRFGLEESTNVADDEIEQTVTETARMLEIDALLDRHPRDLSGGQQQRVALGRAIVRDPQAFLMDEPLSNLDARLRAEMRTELKRLQGDLDVTTIYVTHDQTEAMTMGDRIAILNDGRLQQVATPLECYHRPANLFVAGFIGEPSMNFFDVTRTDGQLVATGFEYPLSPSTLEAVGDRTDLVLGIRPEDIEVVEPSRAANYDGESHAFDANVDVVEPMGDENNVYFTLEDGSFTATVHGFHSVDAGTRVTVRFPESAIHLFDAETGEAVHNRSLEDVADETRTQPLD